MFKLALSTTALAMTAIAASAAALPAQSKIGEIFASPPKAHPAPFKEGDIFGLLFPKVRNSPKVPGYYGRPGYFYYSSYYGPSPDIIFWRLPYACGFAGTCAGFN